MICSDKTGTLTMNQMTARALVFQGRRFAVTGEGYAAAGAISAGDGAVAPAFDALLQAAALANDSRIRDGQLIGDPTEGALLALAAKGGVDAEHLAAQRPRIAEIPFDSAYKFQATFHHRRRHGAAVREGSARRAAGARGRHLARRAASGGAVAMDDAARAHWAAENEHLASQAMRVLAVAGKDIAARDFDPAGDLMAHMRDLTLLGLVGLIDPPRPEAREAIAAVPARRHRGEDDHRRPPRDRRRDRPRPGHRG